MEKSIVEALAEDEKMKDWTPEERKRLLLKMRIFQMGLSAMIANGHIPSWLDEKAAEELLMEVGDDVLLAHQEKRKESKK